MYADSVTKSMEKAITETQRRRDLQMAYNQKHNIVPKTIVKKVSEVLEISNKKEVGKKSLYKNMSKSEKIKLIEQMKKEMKAAAKMLEFEHAAFLRDEIKKLEG